MLYSLSRKRKRDVKVGSWEKGGRQLARRKINSVFALQKYLNWNNKYIMIAF